MSSIKEIETKILKMSHGVKDYSTCTCDIKSQPTSRNYDLLINKYSISHSELWEDLITLIHHKKNDGSYIILFFNAEIYLDELVKIFRLLPNNKIKYDLYFARAPSNINAFGELIKNCTVENLWMSTDKYSEDFVDLCINFYCETAIKNLCIVNCIYDYPRNLCDCFSSVNLTSDLALKIYVAYEVIDELFMNIATKILARVSIKEFCAYGFSLEKYLSYNLQSVQKITICLSTNTMDVIRTITTLITSVKIIIDDIRDDDKIIELMDLIHNNDNCVMSIDFDSCTIYENITHDECYCGLCRLMKKVTKRLHDNNFWATQLLMLIVNGDKPNLSINYPATSEFFTSGVFTNFTGNEHYNIIININSYTVTHDVENLNPKMYIYMDTNDINKNITINCIGYPASIIIAQIKKNVFINNLTISCGDICEVIKCVHDTNLCIGRLLFRNPEPDSDCCDIINKLTNINKLTICNICFDANTYHNNLTEINFKKFVLFAYDNIDIIPQITFSFVKGTKLDKNISKIVQLLQNNKKDDTRFVRCKVAQINI